MSAALIISHKCYGTKWPFCADFALNSLALKAAKTGLTILEISNLQKHILKKNLK